MKKEIRIARQKLYLDCNCKVCLLDISKKGLIWTRHKTDDIRVCKDLYCSQTCLMNEFKAEIGKVQTNAVYTAKMVITPQDIERANAPAVPVIPAQVVKDENAKETQTTNTTDSTDDKPAE